MLPTRRVLLSYTRRPHTLALESVISTLTTRTAHVTSLTMEGSHGASIHP